jgi:hypothetical protein
MLRNQILPLIFVLAVSSERKPSIRPQRERRSRGWALLASDETHRFIARPLACGSPGRDREQAVSRWMKAGEGGRRLRLVSGARTLRNRGGYAA